MTVCNYVLNLVAPENKQRLFTRSSGCCAAVAGAVIFYIVSAMEVHKHLRADPNCGADHHSRYA